MIHGVGDGATFQATAMTTLAPAMAWSLNPTTPPAALTRA